jgi:hypothetical protein
MIEKSPLVADRVREIRGSFAFIEHRFLRNGFWASLGHHELLLYLFLILVADRRGLSYYSFDKICSLLAISADEYILARDALIDQDLIAFDGHLFQVLSLPAKPVRSPDQPLRSQAEMTARDPATIQRIIHKALEGSR